MIHYICYTEGVDQEGLKCRACHAAVAERDFKKKRAVLILNEAYCAGCVGQGALQCHTCKAALQAADFESGRAVVLLGQRYCVKCLDLAVIRGKIKNRTGPGSDPRLRVPQAPFTRMAERFVPPPRGRLELKPRGLRGLFRGNVVLEWLDVSTGGVRARVSGRHEREEILGGKILHTPSDRPFPFTAVIRFVGDAPKDSGGVIVGCAFLAPPPELQAFIREHLSRDPVMSAVAFRKEGGGAPVPPADLRPLRKNA